MGRSASHGPLDEPNHLRQHGVLFQHCSFGVAGVGLRAVSPQIVCNWGLAPISSLVWRRTSQFALHEQQRSGTSAGPHAPARSSQQRGVVGGGRARALPGGPHRCGRSSEACFVMTDCSVPSATEVAEQICSRFAGEGLPLTYELYHNDPANPSTIEPSGRPRDGAVPPGHNRDTSSRAPAAGMIPRHRQATPPRRRR